MIRVYTRVSSGTQTIDSQLDSLKRWALANSTQPDHSDVVWYTDTYSGLKKMAERPGFARLAKEVAPGDTVVCWAIDRLGRRPKDLFTMIEDWTERGIRLVVTQQGIDFSTPIGKLVFGILASVAGFEAEFRRERQRAGIEAKRDPKTGRCMWAGRKGRNRTTPVDKIIEMLDAKVPKMRIAAGLGLSVTTVKKVFKREYQQQLKLRSEQKTAEPADHIVLQGG